MNTSKENAAAARAAARTEYLNALEQERAGYERAGLKDRAAEVSAEIERAQAAAPEGRTSDAPVETAETAPTEPAEGDAAARAKRGKGAGPKSRTAPKQTEA